jgi:hypothetical protein
METVFKGPIIEHDVSLRYKGSVLSIHYTTNEYDDIGLREHSYCVN